MKKLIAILILTLLLSLPLFIAEAGQYSKLPYKELLFPPGELPSSHAASVVELPDGELFVVWYAATHSSNNSVLWASRKPAGAGKWTKPLIIHSMPGHSNKNPVLYLNRNGKLLLFWADEKRLPKRAFKWTIDTLKMKTSDDFGRTWSQAHDVGAPMGFLPRTHIAALNNGTLLLPLYVNWSTSSVVMASKDNGLTWQRPKYMLYFFGIQPTIIQRSDSSLFALTRTGMWPRLAWQAISYNFGNNWKRQWVSNVQNPGTSLEMLKLKNGNVVLAFNDSKKDLDTLSLALSRDEGKTWPYVKIIECKRGSIHTYPSLIQDKNGSIHVFYSYDGRCSIAHFVTDEKWLEGQSSNPPAVNQ